MDISANPRNYVVIANKIDANASQFTYTAEFDRVTSFGDTRVIDAGDTRIIHVSETSNPYELIANKRNYMIIAPEVS